jgi:hypothetical protein
MSSGRRKRSPKLKQTESPFTRPQEIGPEHFSSPHDKLKKPETKIASQEDTEPQKHNTVSSRMCGFNKTQTRSPSQEAEQYDGIRMAGLPSIKVKKPNTRLECKKIEKYGYSKIADSPSFELRELNTTSPPSKDDKCADSRREGSRSFEVKEEENTAPCEQAQNCYDLEMSGIHQKHFTDLKLKEPGVAFQKSDHSMDVSRTETRFREFERLKRRLFELDNERAALTEAIGNEIGLTTNMQQLHEYNTIKDITQIIIGSLSNILDVPVTQLHQELNLKFQE